MTNDSVIERARVDDLLIDGALYPRGTPDRKRIRELHDAVASGAELPPLIVDRESMKVVDGVHRLIMWQERKGADLQVEVEFRDYATDAEIFLDSVRINASHGVPLGDNARRVCLSKAARLKIDPTLIASALSVTPVTLERLQRAAVGPLRSNGVRSPPRPKTRRLPQLGAAAPRDRAPAVLPPFRERVLAQLRARKADLIARARETPSTREASRFQHQAEGMNAAIKIVHETPS